MVLLGYDIGSSAIKAALLDVDTGEVIASTRAPRDVELSMSAPSPGWAEQPPSVWWGQVKEATAQLRAAANFDPAAVQGIGLAYQMHGLVLIDESGEVLRPSIIWCDSRAVPVGEKAFEDLGPEWCMRHLLNSPGNFTASKLAWVKQNEPEVFARVHRAMLPGDYVAMRMTGEVVTTSTGLSEGTLWDVERQGLAVDLLDHFGIPHDLIPPVAPTFGEQGWLTSGAAEELGLQAGTPVAYRAGDQPNNAFSLGVTEPGQAATTAGTSGVVYGVADEPLFDEQSRVNSFLHVNHTAQEPRYGTLMCVNGTGILNRWMRENVAPDLGYDAMNARAAESPIGAGGIVVLPYGNGAERTLGNRDLGSSVHGLRFNEHTQADLLRAGQEGIVYALNYGCDIMRDMGMEISTVRAGQANMFLSLLFSESFATLLNATVELVDTDGAQGAARGAGVGVGLYDLSRQTLTPLRTIEPDPTVADAYNESYQRWLSTLHDYLNHTT